IENIDQHQPHQGNDQPDGQILVKLVQDTPPRYYLHVVQKLIPGYVNAQSACNHNGSGVAGCPDPPRLKW
ncbi:MAG: hypothetical protein KJ555_08760, partial [Proteobacteria bacterium]|nr:hypothetical protein [Pseudomonadota bacterium]